MDEIQCKEVALFRYGVINDFVNQVHLERGIQTELIRYKCNRSWIIPYSNRTRIARSTILYWIKLYNDGGKRIESLYPRGRTDKNTSRTIDDLTASNLVWLTTTSNITSSNMLIIEMNNQHLVTPGTILKLSTVYRFLNNNNLTSYLTNRHKHKGDIIDNYEENTLWLRKLVLGKIHLDDLKTDLTSRIPSCDVEALYNCILRKGVYYRNRAIGILSLCKGIAWDMISEYLMIPRSTLLSNYNRYQAKGVDSIISDKGKRPLLHEDSKVIHKIFSILHSPPSTYGFNRTSWRQEDIRKVMEDSDMRVSKHIIKKVINLSGFTYRKARTVLTSTDPQYNYKLEQIKAILSRLGPREKFFSIDEYGPFAVKLQGGRSLVPPYTTKIVPQWQKSKGSIILTAALELSTNQVIHFYSNNKNTIEMIKLLDMLVNQYSNEDCIYFSWDSASWHASKNLYLRVDEINSMEYKSKTKSAVVKCLGSAGNGVKPFLLSGYHDHPYQP